VGLGGIGPLFERVKELGYKIVRALWVGRASRAIALLGAAALAAGVLALISSEEPAGAALPGDNGKIVFAGFSDPNTCAIYTMNADGSNLTNISNPDIRDESCGEPMWSPDGTKIAFRSFREVVLPRGSDFQHDIYTMAADGSNQTNITKNVGGERFPTWSPDGKKIAFVSELANGPLAPGNIYTMAADGSNKMNITNTNDVDESRGLDWSPDGTKIAFVGKRDGNYEIYTMDADGSNQTNISKNTADDGWPAVSPDGTKIAFVSNRDGNHAIYTMNADGSGQPNILYKAGFSAEPAWSPDGTKIAFESGQYIHTMNPDGSNVTPLLNTGPLLHPSSPDWQRILPNTAPPTITGLRPPPGSTTTDPTPIIAATVADQQTDLTKSDITLVLDDVTIPQTSFSYNQKTDRMTYTPASDLSLGKHALKVIAQDGSGLSTTKRWNFTILQG
jgi:TolB protein